MAIKINKSECIGCGACVNTCPLELIQIVGDEASISDEDACIECGACVDSCPLGVIVL